MNRSLIVLALAAVSCPGTDKDPTDNTDDTETDYCFGADSDWSVVADQIDGGMLLGAWSDGDETLMVGGDVAQSRGHLVRYDGTSLCVEENVADAVLWWIHGAGEGEWYAVGEDGVVVHDVGGVRTREDVANDEIILFGVYDDGTDVWAVGGNFQAAEPYGQIWRKQPGSAFELFQDNTAPLFKIWEGWIVGVGEAYFIDNGTLVERHPPNGERLLTVRGKNTDDVWAVGGDASPVLMHWHDSAWEKIEVDSACVNQPLNGVYTDDGEDIWIAGHFGNAARFDGTAFTCTDFPVTSEHFHAVWPHGDCEILWVGGNLFSASNNFGTLARYGAPGTLGNASTCAR